MKAVMLIIDGLGDTPNAALGDKTPLEAARTPVMDRLASMGRYGLVDPIGPGETPSTYSGVGILMGMVPGMRQQLSRGPVEAAGLGLSLAPGDVALRANFATVFSESGQLLVSDRRAGRISDGVEELAASLTDIDLGDGVTGTLKATHQHRAVLILKGPGLKGSISDTDPGSLPLPAPVVSAEAQTAEASFTAEKVNLFVQLAHERLRDHPINKTREAAGLPAANGVITRGAGRLMIKDNIISDNRLKASVVTACNTVKGLGNLFGFAIATDERFTGDTETDMEAKIARAKTELENNDLVYVHIKAPDICAHDQLPLAKRDMIEKIDVALEQLADLPIMIGVTGDHTTDSNTGLHTDDPVPSLLYRADNRVNGKEVKFGEASCRAGNLPRQPGHSFLLEIVDAGR